MESGCSSPLAEKAALEPSIMENAVKSAKPKRIIFPVII
jgi:hypothetical protein